MTLPLITIDAPALRLDRLCGDGALGDAEAEQLGRAVRQHLERKLALGPLLIETTVGFYKPLVDSGELR